MHHYQRKNGLQDNVVYNMFLDNNNALWIALDNGIARIDITSPLTYFNADLGLTSNVMVLERHNGVLYAGTTEGASYLDPGSGKFMPVQNIGFQCFDMKEIDNQLYTGSQNGFQRIEGSKAVNAIDNLNFNFGVLAIHHYRKNPDYLIIGAGGGAGILKRSNNKNWTSLGRVQEFNDPIWSFAEDQQGRLWMGTEVDGVIRLTFNSEPGIEDVTIERFGTEHGLPKGQVFIYELDGKMYFAPVKGFYTFNEDTQKFSPDNTFGEKAMEMGTILESNGSGEVFLSHYKGAAKAVKQSDGNYSINATPFNPFINAILVNILAEDNGITWFATSIGLIRYDGNIPVDYNQDFNTLIRQVSVSGDSVKDSIIYHGTQHGAYKNVFTVQRKQSSFQFLLRRSMYRKKLHNIKPGLRVMTAIGLHGPIV